MTDALPQIDVDGASPLNAWDAQRSMARVADIELGLTNKVDAWFWRDKAMRRIEALEDDQQTFGLVPHEVAELAQLKALLESSAHARSPNKAPL